MNSKAINMINSEHTNGTFRVPLNATELKVKYVSYLYNTNPILPTGKKVGQVWVNVFRVVKLHYPQTAEYILSDWFNADSDTDYIGRFEKMKISGDCSDIYKHIISKSNRVWLDSHKAGTLVYIDKFRVMGEGHFNEYANGKMQAPTVKIILRANKRRQGIIPISIVPVDEIGGEVA